MAIYNAVLTELDIDEVQRYAGLAETDSFDQSLAAEAAAQVLAMAQPRGSWQQYSYDCCRNSIMACEPVRLQGKNIRQQLSAATEVAVLAVTLGKAAEQKVTELFADGHYTAGLLLDAAATTAVEAAADSVDAMIAAAARSRGLMAVKRFSPGYGDWDIAIQKQILALADGAAIGVRVNEASMLLPRKSVTAVIGLVPLADAQTRKKIYQQGCGCCGQKNCLARREC